MSLDHQYEYGPNHEPVTDDISLTSRVHILAELSQRRDEFMGRDGFAEFFAWTDYALPLAVSLDSGGDIALNEDDYEMLFEAWVDFTHLLGISHHFPFESVDNCLTHSTI